MAEPHSEDNLSESIDEDDIKQSLDLQVPLNSGTLHMVNSPTTDTLDSVILETTHTDDGKSEESNEEEIKLDISETEESQEIENLNERNADTTDTVEEPRTSGQQMGGNQVVQVQHDEPTLTNLSSYFSSDPPSLSSGADFFDAISSSEPPEPILPASPGHHAAPIVESNTLTADSSTDMSPQTLVPEAHVEEEGETVEFEGETGHTGKEDLPVEEMEADDNFESFTAEHEVLGSPNLTNMDNQQMDTHITSATPPQLSPLTTPVHQPTVDPLSAYIQALPSAVERQAPLTLQKTSPVEHQTSAPASPFHQFQTTAMPSVFDNFGDSSQTEDPFTASLCMSDSDRRHNAWIPSDATRHILISMTSSVPGTYMPAVEQLCSPSILITEPQGDPVRDLVFRYMGEQEAVKRHVLTAASVSRDEKGLAILVAAGCLRAAVDLTGHLLTDEGQGYGQNETGKVVQHSPKTLQLWFCRFALLMRLKLYELLESEMRVFNSMDSPDLYFEFYPQVYPGRRGSMVSFGLRILHAELPHFLSRNQESLDKLYYILAVTSKIVKNLENGLSEDGACIELTPESQAASLKLWHSREIQVEYKIASVLLSMKDYEASISIFEMLADKECENKIMLLSGIGRIYLQMGNISKATGVFKEVEGEASKKGNSVMAMNSSNKGFLAMCANNFSDAYEHFKSAVQLEPSNTCAVNNMAVCSLYMCRLKDALNTLEALVHNDPGQNLHEGVLFNLCTLYELESSRALHKKQAVLDMVNKHKGDGFPVICLKMS